MPWILANTYKEEPDALIALVRVCGGALRETGDSTQKREDCFAGIDIPGSSLSLKINALSHPKPCRSRSLSRF
jgi:hypothetical protein